MRINHSGSRVRVREGAAVTEVEQGSQVAPSASRESQITLLGKPLKMGLGDPQSQSLFGAQGAAKEGVHLWICFAWTLVYRLLPGRH